MVNQANKILRFLEKNIPLHPADIVDITSKHFQVTRTTVHRHLSKLVDNGDVIKSGKTRDVMYYLTKSMNQKAKFQINSGIEEFEVYNDYLKNAFLHLPKNVETICHYGFTEIFNNAKDHSRGKTIWIESECIENQIKITVDEF